MSDKNGSGRAVGGGPIEPPEPIAIVGIGCRFPGGASSPAAFWELLKNGTDAVTEVPADRWSMSAFFEPDPKKPGKTYARWGGFLDQIDRFDAQFFRIAPREAVYMDPQQRLLLEVCWEALEDAGQDVDRLAGTNTGVFIGASTHDYSDMQAKDPYAADPYTNTGCTLSIAANRLSYLFDLRGPSIAVDTACSSSLIAVHLACQSLWSGECSMALTGGVNCMLTPEPTIGFSLATMLSPNGRCRTFDAGADGYVRGEGAGLAVLKRLSDATAARDPIYAVIIGTGANQDGHTSSLTVPSAEAQEALMREVYRRANVSPDRLLYFEAHGTGTPVGDPIEAAAIGGALGRLRSPGNPLRMGSFKTNIGHLEAGAGIAGLIKAALVIRNRAIPPSLNFHTPNPRIPLEALGLRVQTQFEIIPDDVDASVVGVNAFGFGGANAHVALDRAPATAAAERPAVPAVMPSTFLLALSARSPEALHALVGGLRDRIGADGESPLNLGDLCYTAGARRTHHDHRVAITASSLTDLTGHLDAFIRSEASPAVVRGRRASGRRPKLAFVFSGMGPQWWAMGQQLLTAEPVFRRAVDECDVAFRQLSGWSVLEQMTADASRSRMDEAQVAQPANFALQVGLAALWRSWGIVPDAIVGHSAGEVAAAHAAGALTLEDAVLVIYHRSRLQHRTTDKGRMLAVGLPASQAAAVIGRFRGRVSLAAVNSPRSVTLAGDREALEQIESTLRDSQVFARMLSSRVPYHSHFMDPLEDELLSSLAGLAPRESTVPFYAAVTGERADGRELDGAYWWANMRQPVSFAPAIEKILDDGVDGFIELSPHPVLGRAVVEIQSERENASPAVLASMRRDTNERTTLLAALAVLYTLGARVDWVGVNGEGSCVTLPGYPWQRERYWTEPEVSVSNRLPTSTSSLLQQRLASVNPTWQAHLDGHRLTYLRDHVVQGSAVFPTSAYIEAALAASRELTGELRCDLEEVRFKRALVLREEDEPKIQLAVQLQDSTFTVHSSPKAGQPWTLNASGRLVNEKDGTNAAPTRTPRLAAIRTRCRRQYAGDRCYAALAAVGLQYGPCFRGIEQIWHGQREALGRIRWPEALATTGAGDHIFHPAVLDSCFQVISGAAFLQRDASGAGDTYLPVEIGRFRFTGEVPGAELWCHAKLVNETRNSIQGDFSIFDDGGRVIVEITGFKCQRVPNQRAAAGGELTSYLHEMRWVARTLPSPNRARQVDYLPAVATLAAPLFSPEALTRYGRTVYYDEVSPRIEQLCAAYVQDALHQLGWRPRRGQRVEFTKLADRLNVVPAQRPHFRRLIDVLEEVGVLSRSGTGWVVADVSRPPTAKLRQEIDAYPAYGDTLVTLDRCAAGLAGVLRGERDQRQLLFPDGSLADLRRHYADSPIIQVYNAAVRDAVSAMVRGLPKDRTIRVLEIGAGTAGSTVHLLPVLPAERTEYVFTDVSDVFVEAAKTRLADFPFVEFGQLNIEQDPEAQGFAPHSFDLIVAVDVLHAATDLRQALSNTATLLASGGLLVAIEITRNWRLFDIMYGPLKDWWNFPESDVRSSRFWLSAPAWREALAAAGFAESAVVADTPSGTPSDQAVVLARTPQIQDAAVEEPSVAAETPRAWVILGDRGGAGDHVALGLESRGDVAIRVIAGERFARLAPNLFTMRPESLDDMAGLVKSVAIEFPNCRGVVHLWCAEVDDLKAAGTAALDDVQGRGCVSILHLVQILGAEGISLGRLWLVTRGAQAMGDGSSAPRPAQALLWGQGRVIMNEQPQLQCTLVDLDPEGEAEECAHLVEELNAGDAEQEVAWRGGVRRVVRFTRAMNASSQAADAYRAVPERTRPYQLEAVKPGALESLRLSEVQRRKPGRRDVEISVRAAGVNFRDVMKAMGMYLDHLGEAFQFGDECAGTITRVGEDVTEFQAGDEVIGVGPGCFGSLVTMPVHYVVPKPAAMSFEQAASIPIVFLTVHYALNHVARLKQGERILIHSAAGGVGLAAVQLAQNAGAEIFATAGSPEKRALLTSLGVRHVMDSRSLAFADEVVALTGGRGLDVVLNSLAGEFLVKSLALLRPTGRFIELGKVDFFENTRLGLAPFKQGLSFMGVDLGFLLATEPERCKQLFAEVMEMFADGRVRPLPVRTFPIAEASSAFRLIAQARHVGKVALTMNGQPRTVARVPTAVRLFRDDATYLVTGGTRGFGLSTAGWMVEQGAKHIVLAGRTGVISPDAEAGVERLRGAGAEVVVRKVDVASDEAVRALLCKIDRSLPPLKGVFHAAMVIDDGFLLNLDAERFRRVLAPKAAGAWNLHRQTLDLKLDHFVLFSSMSAIQGTPGQGNYAAANAFLDALAHHRRALNLPALSVNWGAISEVGYVARNLEVTRELEKQGIRGIAPADAGVILGMLMRAQRSQTAAMRMDLEHLSVVRASEAASRRFAIVLRQSPQDSAHASRDTPRALLSLLAASPPDARPQLVEASLKADLARVLGVREAQIDPDQPLALLGVDSLMSVELETVVSSGLGIDLPLGFLVSDNVSLRYLSRRLADQCQPAIDQLAAGRGPGIAA